MTISRMLIFYDHCIQILIQIVILNHQKSQSIFLCNLIIMKNVKESDTPCAQLRARCELIENQPEWNNCLSKIDTAVIDITSLVKNRELMATESYGVILNAFVIFLKDERNKLIHESAKLRALVPSKEQNAFAREVSEVLRIIDSLIESADKVLILSDHTKDANWITPAEAKWIYKVWVETNL